MDPKEETRRILQALKQERASLGWGGAKSLDRKMGRAEGYVHRLLKGGVQMTLEHLFELLAALEIEPGAFFASLYGVEYRVSPDRFLRRLERRCEPTELLKRIDRIVDRKPLPGSGPKVSAEDNEAAKEMSAEIRRIDELRFSNPVVAEEESSEVLHSIVELAERTGHFQEILCDALALTSSIEGALSRYVDSAAYATRGLAIANEKGYVQKVAAFFQRCVYLAGFHGQHRLAIDFAQQARLLYVQVCDLAGVGKSLVDQAIMLRSWGDPAGATVQLKAALKYIPKEHWQYRCTAYQSLGIAYMETGDLEQAEKHVALVVDEHRTKEGPNWRKVKWLQAEIAFRKVDFSYAESMFQSLRDDLAKDGQVIDLSLTSMRLAKMFVVTGRTGDLHKLAAEMVQFLAPLRQENKLAASIIDEFLRLSLVENVSEGFLEQAYKSIEQAAKQAAQKL